MLQEANPLCGLSLEHNPQVGFCMAAGRGEFGEELEHKCLFADSKLLRLEVFFFSFFFISRASYWNLYLQAVWYDLASNPTESESEHSLSGFLSVASYSCEEDEGRDTPFLNTLRRPSAYRGPSGMSGEANHGNQPSQHNGVKHRWAGTCFSWWCCACLLD